MGTWADTNLEITGAGNPYEIVRICRRDESGNISVRHLQMVGLESFVI